MASPPSASATRHPRSVVAACRPATTTSSGGCDRQMSRGTYHTVPENQVNSAPVCAVRGNWYASRELTARLGSQLSVAVTCWLGGDIVVVRMTRTWGRTRRSAVASEGPRSCLYRLRDFLSARPPSAERRAQDASRKKTAAGHFFLAIAAKYSISNYEKKPEP